MHLVLFDEYLRLHVGDLPENHLDIALSFNKLEDLMKRPGNLIRPLSTIKRPYVKNNLNIATTLQRLGLAYMSVKKQDSHNMEDNYNDDYDWPI